MAKDPAMLWYWSDWFSGTSLLSRFLKGCYIDVLNAQFNNGPLSLEEIKTCLGSDFGTSWPTLQKKFKQTAEGLFFNERLELEKEKRKAFCESRRNNREKKTHVQSYDKHMKDHMENENRNTILSKEKKEEELLWTTQKQLFFNDFNWVHKFCRDKAIPKLVMERKMIEFIEDLELQEDFKALPELKKHYFHWFKKNISQPSAYKPSFQDRPSAPPLTDASNV